MEDSTINDPEEQRAIARIERALESLGSEYSPPPGWEEQVLAATKETWWSRLAAWQRSLFVGVPSLSAAAAAAMIWLGGPATLGRVQIAQDMVKTRSSDKKEVYVFSPDKELELLVEGGEKHRALRIYKGNELVFICETKTSKPGCNADADRMTVTWKPEALGHYKVLVLSSPERLPATQHHFDKDDAEITRSGAHGKAPIETRTQAFEIK